MEQQHVVVYRSQHEARMDQFWMDHPELVVKLIQYGVGIIVLIILISCIRHHFYKKRMKSLGFGKYW